MRLTRSNDITGQEEEEEVELKSKSELEQKLDTTRGLVSKQAASQVDRRRQFVAVVSLVLNGMERVCLQLVTLLGYFGALGESNGKWF